MYNKHALLITDNPAEVMRSLADILKALEDEFVCTSGLYRRLAEHWKSSDEDFLWGDAARLFLRFTADRYLTIYLVIPPELGGSGAPIIYWKLWPLGFQPEDLSDPDERVGEVQIKPEGKEWEEVIVDMIRIAIEETHSEAIAKARALCHKRMKL